MYRMGLNVPGCATERRNREEKANTRQQGTHSTGVPGHGMTRGDTLLSARPQPNCQGKQKINQLHAIYIIPPWLHGLGTWKKVKETCYWFKGNGMIKKLCH